MNQNYKKMVFSALFAALVCVATFIIKIPTPGTNGYVHPGDALVILSGIFLGPVYGALAAGIGSALADLLGGYFIYVPITFLIKGLSALCIGFFFHHLFKADRHRLLGVGLGGLINAFLVVTGYFLAETLMYSASGAAAGILPNIFQGLTGIVLSLLLYPVLSKIYDLNHLADKAWK